MFDSDKVFKVNLEDTCSFNLLLLYSEGSFKFLLMNSKTLLTISQEYS